MLKATILQITPAVCLHLQALSHPILARRLRAKRKETLSAQALLYACPISADFPYSTNNMQRKGFMTLLVIHTMNHERRTAPIRQTASTILGGALLAFTILLGFANPSWALQVSPSALTFSATSGGADPSPQTVALSTSRSRERTWTVTENAPWITVTPSSGTIATETDTISVRAIAAGLAAGSYSTHVTITETSRSGRIRRTILPVTLSITQSTSTSGFSVSPPSLAYAGTVGGPNQVLGVTLTNTGNNILTVTWFDSINWLVATSGDTVTIAPGGSAMISHTASTAGLTAGTYSGTATISGGGMTKQMPITMTVTSGSITPAIGFSPTNLTFAGTVGGATPAPKPISISNTGSGTLSWTASDNAAWLALSPVSGTNSGTVTASVNMTGLVAGTYNSIVTITASGSSNSPRQIPVSFILSATTAGTATLTWNASTESDLTGYKVYRGTASGTYGAPLVTLPKATTNYTAAGLQNGTTYFFVITGYDSSGNESTYSNEVSKSIF